MPLTMYEALEIYNHPKDLAICAKNSKEDARYSICIFRGPGHNFKPLITSKPFTAVKKEAIGVIKHVLETSITACEKTLKGNTLLSGVLRGITDQSLVLNKKLIVRILNDLRKKNGEANTYKYK